jgi:hypothetical protein
LVLNSRFFSANFNSVNYDINLYLAFLGIVRHFELNKFYVLQPVIASWCVNNFDIFHTICDGFEFDVDNYFNYFFDLMHDCDCYDDFDTLCFNSLNETAAMFHISYVTKANQFFPETSTVSVKEYLSYSCLHANKNTALFCADFYHFSVNLQLINGNLVHPICVQLLCNDEGHFVVYSPFPIADDFVYICAYNGHYFHLNICCPGCGGIHISSYNFYSYCTDACTGRLNFSWFCTDPVLLYISFSSCIHCGYVFEDNDDYIDCAQHIHNVLVPDSGFNCMCCTINVHDVLMPAVCTVYDSFNHCNDVFDGGGEVFKVDQGDHILCDRSVHADITCNDLVGDICTKEVVHDDLLLDCTHNVIGLPMVLSKALYSTSNFKHIQFCTVTNCTSCVTIRSSFLSSLHAVLGFLPASTLPLFPPLPVLSPHIPSPPQVVSSLSSYISGSPNFISKVAPFTSG